MNGVLFVDDEPDVLNGLRNVFRVDRARWHMGFAQGGEAALQELAARPFGVIVTDMRMPRMDGLELLKRVRAGHPQVARIVLSGHAELDLVLRASALAHQYLPKPSEAKVLRAVIDRALGLQALIASDRLRQAVGALGSLPSAPGAYHRLKAALADPNVEIRALASIVKGDVGLAVRVLQFVNSAYCGLVERVTSIEGAITCLGIDTLCHLALTVDVLRDFGACATQLFGRLEGHALLTASLACKLVSDPARRETAFAAGLLHDAGRLVLASRAPAEYARVLEEAQRSKRLLSEVEGEAFGATHSEIGAYLFGLWDLPHELVEAVAYHHESERLGRAGAETLTAVAIANALAHWLGGKDDGSLTPADWDRLAAPGDLERWRELARAEALRLGSGPGPS